MGLILRTRNAFNWRRFCGLASSYGAALYKAEEATKSILPTEGKVLISVSDLDKPEVVELAQGYYDAGFTIVATGKTYELITENGISG